MRETCGKFNNLGQQRWWKMSDRDVIKKYKKGEKREKVCLPSTAIENAIHATKISVLHLTFSC